MNKATLPCKAVLFDLDGTLLDSIQDLGQSMNRALESLGFAPHPLKDYRKFVGAGARLLVERALPRPRLDEKTLQNCLERFLEDYGKHWNEHSKLYDGIAPMLDELTRRKVKLTILSNKPHDFTLNCVEHYLSNWSFEAIWGYEEGGPKKPAPDRALQIARDLGIKLESFCYLGDTAIDMETANRADMNPVGVLWGFRPEELEPHGAKALINNPLDLFKTRWFQES